MLIRILTNYFQVISLVHGFDLVWPSLIDQGLNIFAKITDSQDSFFSMDCIMHQTGFNPDKSYFMEVIIIGLTPLIISLISVPFWLLYNCLAKRLHVIPIENQE